MIFATSQTDIFVEYAIYAAALTTGFYFATAVWNRLGREFGFFKTKTF